MLIQRRLKRRGGFSLIELMVAVAIMGILAMLATPSIVTWTANAQMRAVAASWQSAVRMAQAEAVRSFRQVVIFRTNSTACDATAMAAADGRNYVIRTLPLFTGESGAANQCGSIAEMTQRITMSGPTAMCFNGNGRIATVADPGVGGSACSAGVNGQHVYWVDTESGASNQKKLAIFITLGGSVRMCARDQVVSATVPDGCPALNVQPTS